jgi:hypothetical protein
MLNAHELRLLNEIAENGVQFMNGEKFAELENIASAFGMASFDESYKKVRMHLYYGEWYRISNDGLQLFAMELIRLAN